MSSRLALGSVAVVLLSWGCNGAVGGGSKSGSTVSPSSSTAPPGSTSTGTGASSVTTLTTTSGTTGAGTGATSGTGGTGTGGTGGGTGTGGSGGGWLFVASYDNDTITTFQLDATTGVPTRVGTDLLLPARFGTTALAVAPGGALLFATGGGNAGPSPAPGASIMPRGALVAATIATGSPPRLTLGAPVPTASLRPFGLAFAPSSAGAFAYTAELGILGGGTVSAFTFTASGGLAAATPASQVVGAGSGPVSVACDGTGSYLYTACGADGGVQVVPLAKGVLVGPGSFKALRPANAGPQVVRLDAAGTTLYTGNADGTISVVPVSNGTLGAATLVTATTKTTGQPQILSLEIDPTGTYIVTANGGVATGGGTDEVSLFRITAGTGVPVLVGSAVLPSSAPQNAVWSADGRFVYVADTGAGTLSGYAVGPTGLTRLAGSPFLLPPGDTTPIGLAIGR